MHRLYHFGKNSKQPYIVLYPYEVKPYQFLITYELLTYITGIFWIFTEKLNSFIIKFTKFNIILKFKFEKKKWKICLDGIIMIKLF